MFSRARAWIPFAIVITCLCGLSYLLVQQAIRHSANDPQIQIAEDSAVQLARMTTPPTLPPQKIDMVKSLSPYVILYDDKGQPVMGTVQLDGKLPAPPKSALDYTRNHDRNTFTWEPRKGVRQAAVVIRVNGDQRKGFVLAGRSLREVEKRESMILIQAILGWLVTLFLSFTAVSFLADKHAATSVSPSRTSKKH